MGPLVWWLAACWVLRAADAGNPDAKRLYDDLLSNYNKLVRPVVNTSDVLRVCIKLKLSQLIDVVSYFQIIFATDFIKACMISYMFNFCFILVLFFAIGSPPIKRQNKQRLLIFEGLKSTH